MEHGVLFAPQLSGVLIMLHLSHRHTKEMNIIYIHTRSHSQHCLTSDQFRNAKSVKRNANVFANSIPVKWSRLIQSDFFYKPLFSF